MLRKEESEDISSKEAEISSDERYEAVGLALGGFISAVTCYKLGAENFLPAFAVSSTLVTLTRRANINFRREVARSAAAARKNQHPTYLQFAQTDEPIRRLDLATPSGTVIHAHSIKVQPSYESTEATIAPDLVLTAIIGGNDHETKQKISFAGLSQDSM